MALKVGALNASKVFVGAAAAKKLYLGGQLLWSATRFLDRTNLMPNPSLEGGNALGWFSNNVSLYPVVVDTTSQMSGPNSIGSTRAATGLNTILSSVYLQPGSGSVAPGVFLCTPGIPVVAGVDVKTDTANRRITMYYQWIDGAGATIGTSGTGTIAVTDTGPANTKNRAVANAIPMAGTVACRAIISVLTPTGNAVGGEKTWYDNFICMNDPSLSGIGLEDYFDGDTPAASPYLHNWTGSPKVSTSQRWFTAGDTLNRINMVLNPGFEVGNTCFETDSSAAYPLTVETAAPISGTRTALLTRTATSPTVLVAVMLGTTVGGKFAITPGQPYTGGMSVKTDLAGGRITTRWYWYDSGGVNIATSETTRVAVTVANQVYRVVETATPPGNAVTAYFVVLVRTASGNAIAGQKSWFDQLTIEPGTTDGSYFDGSTPAAPPASYNWTGAVDASVSQRWLSP